MTAKSWRWQAQVVNTHAFSRKYSGIYSLKSLKLASCFLYRTDLRVQVRCKAKLGYVYPDIVATRGAEHFTGEKSDTLINPSLISEVLSPSTEVHDRQDKWFAYQGIASLQEYVLVSQSHVRIEHYQRAGEVWQYRLLNDLEPQPQLPTLSASLMLAQIYENVEFESDDEADNNTEAPTDTSES